LVISENPWTPDACLLSQHVGGWSRRIMSLRPP
jgi:hypothetical protein